MDHIYRIKNCRPPGIEQMVSIIRTILPYLGTTLRHCSDLAGLPQHSLLIQAPATSARVDPSRQYGNLRAAMPAASVREVLHSMWVKSLLTTRAPAEKCALTRTPGQPPKDPINPSARDRYRPHDFLCDVPPFGFFSLPFQLLDS